MRWLLFVLVACSRVVVPTSPTDERVVLALHRSPCYGECPVYTLTIFRDGTVEFVGEHYVRETGKATGRIAPAKLAELEKLIVDLGYLEMADAYTHHDCTDFPSAAVWYRPADRAPKLVEHYHGDRKAPDELTAIEYAIDRAVDSKRWVGPRDPLSGQNGSYCY